MFKRGSISWKGICFFVLTAFVATIIFSDVFRVKDTDAAVTKLPSPTDMVNPSKAYTAPLIKGLRIDPQNPLNFEFIVDSENQNDMTAQEMNKLIRYFLAGLTIAETDLWVNLSPYEKDRIITNELGLTDMGRDLLAQDYILKQLASTLTYPESKLGKEFWGDIYGKIAELTDTEVMPVNTFNKVWITPEKATVLEENGLAIVKSASLDVLLEEDYSALNMHVDIVDADVDTDNKSINDLSSDVMRELILPKIKEEVNAGANFAPLRQIYYALVLGTWFKKKFKQTFFNNYIDQSKVGGIDTVSELDKERIYGLYSEAFKKGVYNYIKKERDASTNEKVSRRYVSGGFGYVDKVAIEPGISSAILQETLRPHVTSLQVEIDPVDVSSALMDSKERDEVAAIKGKVEKYMNDASAMATSAEQVVDLDSNAELVAPTSSELFVYRVTNAYETWETKYTDAWGIRSANIKKKKQLLNIVNQEVFKSVMSTLEEQNLNILNLSEQGLQEFKADFKQNHFNQEQVRLALKNAFGDTEIDLMGADIVFENIISFAIRQIYQQEAVNYSESTNIKKWSKQIKSIKTKLARFEKYQAEASDRLTDEQRKELIQNINEQRALIDSLQEEMEEIVFLANKMDNNARELQKNIAVIDRMVNYRKDALLATIDKAQSKEEKAELQRSLARETGDKKLIKKFLKPLVDGAKQTRKERKSFSLIPSRSGFFKMVPVVLALIGIFFPVVAMGDVADSLMSSDSSTQFLQTDTMGVTMQGATGPIDSVDIDSAQVIFSDSSQVIREIRDSASLAVDTATVESLTQVSITSSQQRDIITMLQRDPVTAMQMLQTFDESTLNSNGQSLDGESEIWMANVMAFAQLSLQQSVGQPLLYEHMTNSQLRRPTRTSGRNYAGLGINVGTNVGSANSLLSGSTTVRGVDLGASLNITGEAGDYLQLAQMLYGVKNLAQTYRALDAAQKTSILNGLQEAARQHGGYGQSNMAINYNLAMMVFSFYDVAMQLSERNDFRELQHVGGIVVPYEEFISAFNIEVFGFGIDADGGAYTRYDDDTTGGESRQDYAVFNLDIGRSIRTHIGAGGLDIGVDLGRIGEFEVTAIDIAEFIENDNVDSRYKFLLPRMDASLVGTNVYIIKSRQGRMIYMPTVEMNADSVYQFTENENPQRAFLDLAGPGELANELAGKFIAATVDFARYSAGSGDRPQWSNNEAMAVVIPSLYEIEASRRALTGEESRVDSTTFVRTDVEYFIEHNILSGDMGIFRYTYTYQPQTLDNGDIVRNSNGQVQYQANPTLLKEQVTTGRRYYPIENIGEVDSITSANAGEEVRYDFSTEEYLTKIGQYPWAQNYRETGWETEDLPWSDFITTINENIADSSRHLTVQASERANRRLVTNALGLRRRASFKDIMTSILTRQQEVNNPIKVIPLVSVPDMFVNQIRVQEAMNNGWGYSVDPRSGEVTVFNSLADVPPIFTMETSAFENGAFNFGADGQLHLVETDVNINGGFNTYSIRYAQMLQDMHDGNYGLQRHGFATNNNSTCPVDSMYTDETTGKEMVSINGHAYEVLTATEEMKYDQRMEYERNGRRRRRTIRDRVIEPGTKYIRLARDDDDNFSNLRLRTGRNADIMFINEFEIDVPYALVLRHANDGKAYTVGITWEEYRNLRDNNNLVDEPMTIMTQDSTVILDANRDVIKVNHPDYNYTTPDGRTANAVVWTPPMEIGVAEGETITDEQIAAGEYEAIIVDNATGRQYYTNRAQHTYMRPMSRVEVTRTVTPVEEVTDSTLRRSDIDTTGIGSPQFVEAANNFNTLLQGLISDMDELARRRQQLGIAQTVHQDLAIASDEMRQELNGLEAIAAMQLKYEQAYDNNLNGVSVQEAAVDVADTAWSDQYDEADSNHIQMHQDFITQISSYSDSIALYGDSTDLDNYNSTLAAHYQSLLDGTTSEYAFRILEANETLGKFETPTEAIARLNRELGLLQNGDAIFDSTTLDSITTTLNSTLSDKQALQTRIENNDSTLTVEEIWGDMSLDVNVDRYYARLNVQRQQELAAILPDSLNFYVDPNAAAAQVSAFDRAYREWQREGLQHDSTYAALKAANAQAGVQAIESQIAELVAPHGANMADVHGEDGDSTVTVESIPYHEYYLSHSLKDLNEHQGYLDTTNTYIQLYTDSLAQNPNMSTEEADALRAELNRLKSRKKYLETAIQIDQDNIAFWSGRLENAEDYYTTLSGNSYDANRIATITALMAENEDFANMTAMQLLQSRNLIDSSGNIIVNADYYALISELQEEFDDSTTLPFNQEQLANIQQYNDSIATKEAERQTVIDSAGTILREIERLYASIDTAGLGNIDTLALRAQMNADSTDWVAKRTLFRSYEDEADSLVQLLQANPIDTTADTTQIQAQIDSLTQVRRDFIRDSVNVLENEKQQITDRIAADTLTHAEYDSILAEYNIAKQATQDLGRQVDSLETDSLKYANWAAIHDTAAVYNQQNPNILDSIAYYKDQERAVSDSVQHYNEIVALHSTAQYYLTQYDNLDSLVEYERNNIRDLNRQKDNLEQLWQQHLDYELLLPGYQQQLAIAEAELGPLEDTFDDYKTEVRALARKGARDEMTPEDEARWIELIGEAYPQDVPQQGSLMYEAEAAIDQQKTVISEFEHLIENTQQPSMSKTEILNAYRVLCGATAHPETNKTYVPDSEIGRAEANYEDYRTGQRAIADAAAAMPLDQAQTKLDENIALLAQVQAKHEQLKTIYDNNIKPAIKLTEDGNTDAIVDAKLQLLTGELEAKRIELGAAETLEQSLEYIESVELLTPDQLQQYQARLLVIEGELALMNQRVEELDGQINELRELLSSIKNADLTQEQYNQIMQRLQLLYGTQIADLDNLPQPTETSILGVAGAEEREAETKFNNSKAALLDAIQNLEELTGSLDTVIAQIDVLKLQYRNLYGVEYPAEAPNVAFDDIDANSTYGQIIAEIKRLEQAKADYIESITQHDEIPSEYYTDPANISPSDTAGGLHDAQTHSDNMGQEIYELTDSTGAVIDTLPTPAGVAQKIANFNAGEALAQRMMQEQAQDRQNAINAFEQSKGSMQRFQDELLELQRASRENTQLRRQMLAKLQQLREARDAFVAQYPDASLDFLLSDADLDALMQAARNGNGIVRDDLVSEAGNLSLGNRALVESFTNIFGADVDVATVSFQRDNRNVKQSTISLEHDFGAVDNMIMLGVTTIGSSHQKLTAESVQAAIDSGDGADAHEYTYNVERRYILLEKLSAERWGYVGYVDTDFDGETIQVHNLHFRTDIEADGLSRVFNYTEHDVGVSNMSGTETVNGLEIWNGDQQFFINKDVVANQTHLNGNFTIGFKDPDGGHSYRMTVSPQHTITALSSEADSSQNIAGYEIGGSETRINITGEMVKRFINRDNFTLSGGVTETGDLLSREMIHKANVGATFGPNQMFKLGVEGEINQQRDNNSVGFTLEGPSFFDTRWGLNYTLNSETDNEFSVSLQGPSIGKSGEEVELHGVLRDTVETIGQVIANRNLISGDLIYDVQDSVTIGGTMYSVETGNQVLLSENAQNRYNQMLANNWLIGHRFDGAAKLELNEAQSREVDIVAINTILTQENGRALLRSEGVDFDSTQANPTEFWTFVTDGAGVRTKISFTGEAELVLHNERSRGLLGQADSTAAVTPIIVEYGNEASRIDSLFTPENSPYAARTGSELYTEEQLVELLTNPDNKVYSTPELNPDGTVMTVDSNEVYNYDVEKANGSRIRITPHETNFYPVLDSITEARIVVPTQTTDTNTVQLRYFTETEFANQYDSLRRAGDLRLISGKVYVPGTRGAIGVEEVRNGYYRQVQWPSYIEERNQAFIEGRLYYDGSAGGVGFNIVANRRTTGQGFKVAYISNSNSTGPDGQTYLITPYSSRNNARWTHVQNANGTYNWRAKSGEIVQLQYSSTDVERIQQNQGTREYNMLMDILEDLDTRASQMPFRYGIYGSNGRFIDLKTPAMFSAEINGRTTRPSSSNSGTGSSSRGGNSSRPRQETAPQIDNNSSDDLMDMFNVGSSALTKTLKSVVLAGVILVQSVFARNDAVPYYPSRTPDFSGASLSYTYKDSTGNQQSLPYRFSTLRNNDSIRSEFIGLYEQNGGNLQYTVGGDVQAEFFMSHDFSESQVILTNEYQKGFGTPAYSLNAEGQIERGSFLHYVQNLGIYSIDGISTVEQGKIMYRLYKIHNGSGVAQEYVGADMSGRTIVRSWNDELGNPTKVLLSIGETANQALSGRLNEGMLAQFNLNGNETVDRVFNSLDNDNSEQIGWVVHLRTDSININGQNVEYKLVLELSNDLQPINARGITASGEQVISFYLEALNPVAGVAVVKSGTEANDLQVMYDYQNNFVIDTSTEVGEIVRHDAILQGITAGNPMIWRNNNSGTTTAYDDFGREVAVIHEVDSSLVASLTHYSGAQPVAWETRLATVQDISSLNLDSLKNEMMAEATALRNQANALDSQILALPRGVNPNPVTIQNHNLVVNRDTLRLSAVSQQTVTLESIEYIKAIGANAVRSYRPVTDIAVLRALEENDIWYIPGLSFEFDISDDSYQEKVQLYRLFSNIAMVEIGNENNYFGPNAPLGQRIFEEGEWARILESTAKWIRDNAPELIVATAHGGVPSRSFVNSCPSVQAWGSNYYGEFRNGLATTMNEMRRVVGPDGYAYFSEIGFDSFDDANMQSNDQAQAESYRLLLDHDNMDFDYVIMGGEAEDWSKDRYGNPTEQDSTGEGSLNSTMPGDLHTQEFFSVFDRDGNPKPAVAVIREIFEQRNKLAIPNSNFDYAVGVAADMEVLRAQRNVLMSKAYAIAHNFRNIYQGNGQAGIYRFGDLLSEAYLLTGNQRRSASRDFMTIVSTLPLNYKGQMRDVLNSLKGATAEQLDSLRDNDNILYSVSDLAVGYLNQTNQGEYYQYRFNNDPRSRVVAQYNVSEQLWQFNLEWDGQGSPTRSIKVKNGQVISETNSSVMTVAEFVNARAAFPADTTDNLRNDSFFEDANQSIAAVYQQLTGETGISFETYMERVGARDGAVLPILRETFFKRDGEADSETTSVEYTQEEDKTVVSVLMPNDPLGRTLFKRSPFGDGHNWEVNLHDIVIKDSQGQAVAVPVGMTPASMALRYNRFGSFMDYEYAAFTRMFDSQEINSRLVRAGVATNDIYNGQMFEFSTYRSKLKLSAIFSGTGKLLAETYDNAISEPLRGAYGSMIYGTETVYYNPSTELTMPMYAVVSMSLTQAENYLTDLDTIGAWGEYQGQIHNLDRNTNFYTDDFRTIYPEGLSRDSADVEANFTVNYLSKFDFSVEFNGDEMYIDAYHRNPQYPVEVALKRQVIENGITTKVQQPNLFNDWLVSGNNFMKKILPGWAKDWYSFGKTNIQRIPNIGNQLAVVYNVLAYLFAFIGGPILMLYGLGEIAGLFGRLVRKFKSSRNTKDYKLSAEIIEQRKKAINDAFAAIDAQTDYGFQKSVVDQASQEIKNTFISRINQGKSTQDIINSYFNAFKRWHQVVIGTEYTQKFDINDLMLLQNIILASGILSFNTAQFNFYLFYDAKLRENERVDERAYTTNEIGKIIRWNQQAIGTLIHANDMGVLASIKKNPDFERQGFFTRITQVDVEDWFRTTEWIKEYRKNDGYKMILSEKQFLKVDRSRGNIIVETTVANNNQASSSAITADEVKHAMYDSYMLDKKAGLVFNDLAARTNFNNLREMNVSSWDNFDNVSKDLQSKLKTTISKFDLDNITYVDRINTFASQGNKIDKQAGIVADSLADRIVMAKNEIAIEDYKALEKLVEDGNLAKLKDLLVEKKQFSLLEQILSDLEASSLKLLEVAAKANPAGVAQFDAFEDNLIGDALRETEAQSLTLLANNVATMAETAKALDADTLAELNTLYESLNVDIEKSKENDPIFKKISKLLTDNGQYVAAVNLEQIKVNVANGVKNNFNQDLAPSLIRRGESQDVLKFVDSSFSYYKNNKNKIDKAVKDAKKKEGEISKEIAILKLQSELADTESATKLNAQIGSLEKQQAELKATIKKLEKEIVSQLAAKASELFGMSDSGNYFVEQLMMEFDLVLGDVKAAKNKIILDNVKSSNDFTATRGNNESTKYLDSLTAQDSQLKLKLLQKRYNESSKDKKVRKLLAKGKFVKALRKLNKNQKNVLDKFIKLTEIEDSDTSFRGFIAKTYHDLSGGYAGSLGALVAYTNMARVMIGPILTVAAASFIVPIVLPAVTFAGWGIFVAAGLGLIGLGYGAAKLFIKAKEKKVGDVKKYGDPVALEEGAGPMHKDVAKGNRRATLMTLAVLGMKGLLDATIMFFTAPILYSFLATNPIVFVAGAALVGMLFIFDGFFMYYFLETIIGYSMGQAMGVRNVKRWGGLRNGLGNIFVNPLHRTLIGTVNKAKQEFENKILPPMVHDDKGQLVKAPEGYANEKWAEFWNAMVNNMRDYDIITAQEQKNLTANPRTGEIAGIKKMPRNPEVRRRIELFVSSLFMDMPQSTVWEEIPSFSAITPLYNEVIMYLFADKSIGDYEALNEAYSHTGDTLLTDLIRRNRDEWENFVERMYEKRDGNTSYYHVDDLMAIRDVQLGKKLEFKSVDPNWLNARADFFGELFKNSTENPKDLLNVSKVADLKQKGKDSKYYAEFKAAYINGDLKGASYKDLKVAFERVVLVGFEGKDGSVLTAEELKRKYEMMQEVRMWVSVRNQPAGRTIRGILNYKQTYTMFAKANFPTKESIPASYLPGINKTDYSYDELIDMLVTQKFEYVFGHQEMGGMLSATDVKSTTVVKDMIALLKKYGFKVAYIVQGDTSDANSNYGAAARYHKASKVDIKNVDKADILYRDFDDNGNIIGYVLRENVIRLSAPVRWGQGKPMNQNNLLKYVKGDVIQFMDMNQDMDIEQTYKIQNAIMKFEEDEALSILGFPEKIMTDKNYMPGNLHGFADRTFNSIAHRFLNWLKKRYHYGHPDFIRRQHIKDLGLIIPTPVNEDIFAAMKAFMYGFIVDVVEFIEAKKARETTFLGIFGINNKFAAGGIEQAMRREIPRLNRTRFSGPGGFSGNLIHALGGIGMYLRKPLIPAFVGLYMSLTGFVGVSPFAAFPSALVFGIIGIIFSQGIAIPGLGQDLSDKGLIGGLKDFFGRYAPLILGFAGILYPALLGGSHLAFIGSAGYVGTGRIFGKTHEKIHNPMLNTDYAKMGNSYTGKNDGELYKWSTGVGETFIVLNVLATIGTFALWPSFGLIWSALFMAIPIAGATAPALFNPGSNMIRTPVNKWAKNLAKDFGLWFHKLGLNAGLDRIFGGFTDASLKGKLGTVEDGKTIFRDGKEVKLTKGYKQKQLIRLGMTIVPAAAVVLAGFFATPLVGFLTLIGLYTTAQVASFSAPKKAEWFAFAKVINLIISGAAIFGAIIVVGAITFIPGLIIKRIHGSTFTANDKKRLLSNRFSPENDFTTRDNIAETSNINIVENEAAEAELEQEATEAQEENIAQDDLADVEDAAAAQNNVANVPAPELGRPTVQILVDQVAEAQEGQTVWNINYDGKVVGTVRGDAWKAVNYKLLESFAAATLEHENGQAALDYYLNLDPELLARNLAGINNQSVQELYNAMLNSNVDKVVFEDVDGAAIDAGMEQVNELVDTAVDPVQDPVAVADPLDIALNAIAQEVEPFSADETAELNTRFQTTKAFAEVVQMEGATRDEQRAKAQERFAEFIKNELVNEFNANYPQLKAEFATDPFATKELIDAYSKARKGASSALIRQTLDKLNPVGGIDLQGIHVDVDPSSSPIMVAPFDLSNFHGFSFKITRMDEINDVDTILLASAQ